MNDYYEEKASEINAYRESAYAVACYLLHKRFKYVTISPKESRLREIIYPKNLRKPIPSERDLRFMKREYIVFLAGEIAEAILSSRCKFEDILPLLDIPSSRNERDREFDEVFWKLIFVDTKLIIYAPWNWQAVITLANQLLYWEKIQYQAARKIIRQAIEEYHEGVRNRISALHHSEYSGFVKSIADGKARARKRMKTATLKVKGEHR